MADNKIKIFAENSNICQTVVGVDDVKYSVIGDVKPDCGFSLSDGSFDILQERINGIKPKTPASSISMNTALRQTSTIANILGQVLATNDLITKDGISVHPDNLDDDGTVIEADIQTHANNVASQLTNYLMQINNLQNGKTRAGLSIFAENYTTDITGIGKEFKNIKEGYTVCGVAQNYVETDEHGEPLKDTSGAYITHNIKTELQNVIDKCNQLERIGGLDKISYKNYTQTNSEFFTPDSRWLTDDSFDYDISVQGKLVQIKHLHVHNPSLTSSSYTSTVLIGKLDWMYPHISEQTFICRAYLYSPSTELLAGEGWAQLTGRVITESTLNNKYQYNIQIDIPSGNILVENGSFVNNPRITAVEINNIGWVHEE